MQRLLLGIVTFIALAALWFLPATANAMSLTVTVGMGGNGTVCEKAGYSNPGELTFNYNDKVTIQFKNEQNTPLEVRNVPGGTFTVDGKTTVSRSFQAKGGFTFGAWTIGNTSCEKATTLVKVKGGWLVRSWPWVLAAVGSVAVILVVGRLGKQPPATGTD